jgi:hypothetical protein
MNGNLMKEIDTLGRNIINIRGILYENEQE